MRCAGCSHGAWPFCPVCGDKLGVISPPLCDRCGRPWNKPKERCPDCPPSQIRVARAPFLYEGPVRSALYRLKFSGWRSVAEALGAAMATVAPTAVDTVTWVPLGRKRRATRGYDQARSLALVVGVRLGVPVSPLLRGDGDRVRQGAARGRGGVGLPADGGPGGRRGRSRPLLSSDRPPSGSVVARGRSPVVDASRRRNDPRKASLGRRAWCDLEVSPAPAGAGSTWSGAVPGEGGEAAREGGDPLGRRMWGQRPGQPDGGSPRRAPGRPAADPPNSGRPLIAPDTDPD
jgi:hypothetical protein